MNARLVSGTRVLPFQTSPLSPRTPPSFRARVHVSEARHLPGVFCKPLQRRVAPSARASFHDAHDRTHATHVVQESKSPEWRFAETVDLPSALLTDPRRQLILKVWHCPSRVDGPSNDVSEEDSLILGFAAVDIATLSTGFAKVDGWYTVTDYVGKRRGQVRVGVTPLEPLAAFKRRRDSLAPGTGLGFPARFTPITVTRCETEEGEEERLNRDGARTAK